MMPNGMVVAQSSNQAPQITSTPKSFNATVARTYNYNPTAVDEDGDPLFWSLDSTPEGMVIHPETGALRWTPTVEQIGSHEIIVSANDIGTLVSDPSLGNFLIVLVGAIGFPPGLDKGFVKLFKGNAKNVENGIEAVINSRVGSEALSIAYIQGRGLNPIFADENLELIYKRINYSGKRVDLVSANPSTGKLTYSETKDTLRESELTKTFAGLEEGKDKFSNSIEAMKKLSAIGDSPYNGTEELIILAERINKEQLSPWGISPNGILQKSGTDIIIDGVYVKVKQL